MVYFTIYKFNALIINTLYLPQKFYFNFNYFRNLMHTYCFSLCS